MAAVERFTPVAPAPAAAPAVPAAPPAPGVTTPDVAELWERVLAAAGSGPKAALAGRARLVELSGATAVLAVAPGHVDTVRYGAKALGELIQQVLGRPVVVQVKPAADGAVAPPAASPPRAASATGSAGAGASASVAPVTPPRGAAAPAGPAALRDHPLVRTAHDLFPGARVIEVRGPETPER